MQDNFEKYKGTLQYLSKRAKEDCWTTPLATIFYMLIGLLIVTIILRVFFFSFGNMLIGFFIFLIEAVAILIPILWFHRQAQEYMQNKCFELERDNPGICEAFDEWKRRVRESLPD
jgi:hypothetical protein